ncbi:terminase [Paractinoplanes rishiriensis]|uniref:Terminase n=1 Tax=Paractinoplanes rishiriensis TaxID=1050105 RepID=A0A919K1I7_9ACTN|nr:terminase [Actinoplanes rishiriensis]GIE98940.1 terminase [Actinoplanes rishiriensis]
MVATALTADEIDLLAPTFIGPTWQRNPDGSWRLPQLTLGWQIAGWCAEYLLADDGGPWRFTREQLRFILWWYAVDATGRFVYRKGVLQRLKGWGKDPLIAVLCLVELVGPSRFSHLDTVTGEPVGIPHPQAWVQVAAVSKDQTRNTMTLFPGLMSDRFRTTHGIKEGAEIIRANRGRQRLEAVTSSYRALEGGRSTFVALNETHHWIRGNNGDRMYETVDGNATKKDSRYLAITNAYLPGEDSVAERMREAYEKIAEGRAVDVGVLYDSIEAHPKTPLTPQALRIVLPKIRGDAVWLRVETIIQSVLDITLSPARSRRMWLNQIVADEDALYGPENWVPLEVEGATLKPGDEITVGFDGGKTDDATALVAIRVADQVAFVLGAWERPDGPAGDGWEVDRQAVDNAVHDAFRVFTVQGFYADVALWESYIADWAAAYGEGLVVKAEGRNPIAWDMRQSLQRVTRAHERLMRSIFDGKLGHDGDRALRRHVLNARRRSNNYGVSFGKESRESPRKVDLYAALMLAHEALYDLRTRGKKTQKRTGRGYFL